MRSHLIHDDPWFIKAACLWLTPVVFSSFLNCHEMVEVLPIPSHHTSLRPGQIPALIGSLNDGITHSIAQAKMQGPITAHSTTTAAFTRVIPFAKADSCRRAASSEEYAFRWTVAGPCAVQFLFPTRPVPRPAHAPFYRTRKTSKRHFLLPSRLVEMITNAVSNVTSEGRGADNVPLLQIAN